MSFCLHYRHYIRGSGVSLSPSVILLTDPPLLSACYHARTDERPMVSLESRPAFKGIANRLACAACVCARVTLLYVHLHLVVAILFNVQRCRILRVEIVKQANTKICTKQSVERSSTKRSPRCLRLLLTLI